jgi:hypothetical protein
MEMTDFPILSDLTTLEERLTRMPRIIYLHEACEVDLDISPPDEKTPLR